MSTNPKEQDDNERPGPSRSFLEPAGERAEDGALTHDSSGESSPTAFLKARNASRERPSEEIPELKRQRISPNVPEEEEGRRARDDNDDDDEGIRMDTDSSSSEDENPAEPIDVDSVDEELEERSKPAKTSSRRSSKSEEGVSTTDPISSQRPQRSEDGEPSLRRFGVGVAIASTSAAAMAPPLSRMMEDSPILDDIYRLPVFENEDRREEEDEYRQRRSGRERTPAVGMPGSIDNLYFQKGVDVNENRGPEAFLQKLHGKQRLMWARKLFFLSTELVFPGFKACSDKSQLPNYMGVRVRSSFVMQALLYADSLFFILWILSYLTTLDILIAVLKQLHGYLSVCLTCLFITVNIFRLRFGLKGNENDEVQYLALFWMTTVIVQIPLFTFIFLTDLFCPALLAFTVTMDGVMMVFILLESIVGFIHFRSLLRDELNIIRMARRSKETSQSRANMFAASAHGQEPVGIARQSPSRGGLQGRDSSSDTDSENNRYASRDDRMAFRMHIRRLSEPRRTEQPNPPEEDDDSDSSEQVTSTSDTIRQRTIRAH